MKLNSCALTYPLLQHSDIDYDIETAFNHYQSFEHCSQVEVKTRFLNFDCCGKKGAHLDLFDIARVFVKPKRDGDEDDAKDENDEEAYGDGHKQLI